MPQDRQGLRRQDTLPRRLNGYQRAGKAFCSTMRLSSSMRI